MAKNSSGVVYLIGAGPGDPDLITVKGKRLLRDCDAVVYDALVANELITDLPERTELHYVGKRAGHHHLAQDEINKLLVDLAGAGKRVVRLKGGDPYVFGRGSEEARHLKAQGVRFEVVCGVTSGVAALAYNGIPCTDRAKSSFVVFATGHKASDKKLSPVPWDRLAQVKGGTLVVYMGIGELDNIVEKLSEGGLSPETPVAVIERGTFPSQRVITSTLKGISSETAAAKISPPALIVVGDVVSLQKDLKWFEQRPLSGKRVMITRLAGQTQDMSDALRSLGAEVMSYPTIAITENVDEVGWQAFEKVTCERRLLVFSSDNGVRHFMKQFLARFEDIRRLGPFKIAAVGRGTAAALGEFGLSVDFIPPEASVQSLADSLLDETDLSDVAIVRIRGNLAAPTFEETLGKGGFKSLPLTVYRTHHPKWPEGLKGKLFEHPPQFIIFTSGSSVKGLFANLNKDEVMKLASGAVLASIGPMATGTIEKFGMKVSIEAQDHTLPALIGAVASYAKNNP